MKPLNQKERNNAFLKFFGIAVSILMLWGIVLFSLGLVKRGIDTDYRDAQKKREQFEVFMNGINAMLNSLDNDAISDTQWAGIHGRIVSKLNEKQKETDYDNSMYSLTLQGYKETLEDKEKIRSYSSKLTNDYREKEELWEDEKRELENQIDGLETEKQKLEIQIAQLLSEKGSGCDPIVNNIKMTLDGFSMRLEAIADFSSINKTIPGKQREAEARAMLAEKKTKLEDLAKEMRGAWP